MARDFGMPAKVITEILDKYATAPKSNMQALEDQPPGVLRRTEGQADKTGRRGRVPRPLLA